MELKCDQIRNFILGRAVPNEVVRETERTIDDPNSFVARESRRLTASRDYGQRMSRPFGRTGHRCEPAIDYRSNAFNSAVAFATLPVARNNSRPIDGGRSKVQASSSECPVTTSSFFSVCRRTPCWF